MTKGVGTVLWMAPELLTGSEHYGPEVDVFSYGVIMWELIACADPWAHLSAYVYIAVRISEYISVCISHCISTWNVLSNSVPM